MTAQVSSEPVLDPNLFYMSAKNRFVIFDTVQGYFCGVEIAQLDDVMIVRLHGDIRLGVGDEALKFAVHRVLDSGHKKIVLNMEGVPYIDSAGIGEVSRSHTTVARAGGELKLACLSKRVDDLLDITKQHTIFDVYDSEPEAVRSYRPPSPGPDFQGYVLGPEFTI